MSLSTGTATDYNDLLAKLITFVTTDATLTAASQNWAIEAQNTTPYTDGYGDTVIHEVTLKAPGLSGSEAIYLQIQAYNGSNGGTLYYNWRLRGATGYNSGQPWNAQPGASPDSFTPLWTSSIPYTFIANGQRVIVIAQVGSVFESCYLGKFLPYGQPSQYPYPVYVGGANSNRQANYADTTNNHNAFFDPQQDYVYWIDGSWQPIENADYPYYRRNMWPYILGDGANVRPTFLEANLDGSYPLFPVRIEFVPPSFPVNLTQSPLPNLLGELDGVFFVPGTGLSSGSTITVGSSTYLVLQNIFRTAANNFAAILES